MTDDLQTVYRLKDDKNEIEILQAASSDPKSPNGLKIENGLLVGTDNWFNAIDSGLLEKTTLHGTITKVFMSGHNDWPEFEMDVNGQRTNWTRCGKDDFYKVGKQIELTFVKQKFKRPIDILGPTTDLVTEIRIEK